MLGQPLSASHTITKSKVKIWSRRHAKIVSKTGGAVLVRVVIIWQTARR